MQEGEKEFVVGGKLAEGVGLGVGNKKIEMKGIVGWWDARGVTKNDFLKSLVAKWQKYLS